MARCDTVVSSFVSKLMSFVHGVMIDFEGHLIKKCCESEDNEF
jgi:hypothetical protein